MAGSVIGEVSALRWQLPVQTPSDKSTEDRMECETIDANGRLMRETALEAPKIAQVSTATGGDQSDPEAAPQASCDLSSRDAEGRMAVASALCDAVERDR